MFLGTSAHQMVGERLRAAVPEGVHENFIVFDGDWVDRGVQVKGTTLKHDAVFVIDARALRENEKWGTVSASHVSLHALGHVCPVSHLCHPCIPLRPQVEVKSVHGSVLNTAV